MSYYDSQWHMHMNTHMRTGLLTRMITQKANTMVVKLNIYMNTHMRTGLLTRMITQNANTTVTSRRLKLYLPTHFILYDPKKVSIVYKILLY